MSTVRVESGRRVSNETFTERVVVLRETFSPTGRQNTRGSLYPPVGGVEDPSFYRPDEMCSTLLNKTSLDFRAGSKRGRVNLRLDDSRVGAVGPEKLDRWTTQVGTTP